MMNSIVCNTKTGAVSEYSWPNFQSITRSHAAGPGGLCKLEGCQDGSSPIKARIQLPTTQLDAAQKKLPVQANISMRGGGGATFTVFCLSRAWSYSFPLRGTGQTRCVFGRGIRENYLGFGIETQGQEFTLDRVEIPLVSSARRL